MSKKLYDTINIDQIFGEVYADCHDKMAKTMPDIDQEWGWMQQEHIKYLFGGLTISEMRPESTALAREFETLLPKKHPVAMATMEAFKADYRDDQIKDLLKEIMNKLQLPDVEVTVLFGNDETQITINPQYKEVHYSKKKEIPAVKKNEAEDIARLAVAGTTVDWIKKMTEQRTGMVQTAEIKPVTGHRYDSFSPVSFFVYNSGNASIEDSTVIFTFPDFVELKRNNVERTMFPDILNPKSSTWVYGDEHRVQFRVGNITLGLGRRSENVFVRIPHDIKEIEVTWFLSCKTAKKYGKLTIKNEPVYIPEYRDVEELPRENPQYEDVVTTLTD